MDTLEKKIAVSCMIIITIAIVFQCLDRPVEFRRQCMYLYNEFVTDEIKHKSNVENYVENYFRNYMEDYSNYEREMIQAQFRGMYNLRDDK